MEFTVVVPFRDGQATIGRLLDSLPTDQPVLVVDDLSATPYQSDRPNVKVLRPKARGYFSGAVNAGVAACHGDVLVLNQDVTLSGSAWREYLGGGYAIAGDGVMGHPAWPNGYVQGTFMFLSRAAWNKVGPLNVRDYPLWGSTAEWQLRACRLGLTARPGIVPGLHHARGKEHYGTAIKRALAAEPGKRDLFIRTPPAVSVIVPCFNYGRYLKDCLKSLLSQTFQSFEIIIADDASTDDSQTLAADWVDPWRAIRYVRQPVNLGTPGNLNRAIAGTYGRYITILSADDAMLPDRIDRLYRMIAANPHHIIYDELRIWRAGKTAEVWGLEEYNFDRLLTKNMVPSGVMFEKAAWAEVGGYPEAMRYGREDWAFAVALGRAGYCGIKLPGYAGYLYRREGQNRSERNRGQEWRQRFIEQMTALFPELYRGERPPMCCGQRSKTTMPSGNRAAKAATVPGAEAGLVLLEYMGGNTGLVSWWGPSGARYETSGTRRRIYVDARDVDFMLGQLAGRAQIFKRVAPRPDAGITPAMAETINPGSTVTITLTDGINDAEATAAAQVLQQRQAETKPRRTRKPKAVADAVIA